MSRGPRGNQTMNHCTLLQAGEIQAVVGDASRDGVGGPQYCGVWSLTSRHRPFNAFGNSYAGLLPGEIRGKAPVLTVLDDTACRLSREADEACPVTVRAEYRVRAPYYLDHTLTFADQKDARTKGCGFREVSWCCYMNCLEDPRLHFLSGGKWFRYISPRHGTGSNIAPAYVPDEALEKWPPRQKAASGDGMRLFHWDRIAKRFDEPFYYGRLGNMAMILVFDTPQWLRFFCSPSGGGGSLVAKRTCPAWDFEWVIPEAEYEVGRTYAFRMRLIYKPFDSDADVLQEYRQSQQELGFIAPKAARKAAPRKKGKTTRRIMPCPGS